jgi:uncharacterized coiled-coil protein SlyX
VSEEQFDTNEAREAVRNFDDARAGSHSETIAGVKVAVRLSKAIDEIERLRARLDAVTSHDLEERFVLEQTTRNQERVIRELSEALAQAQEENKALRIRLDIEETQGRRERYQNEDHYPYDLRQRIVELERDVERLKDRMGGRL